MNPKLLKTLSAPHSDAIEWRNLMGNLECARSKREQFFNPTLLGWLYGIGGLVFTGLAFYMASATDLENPMIAEIQWVKSLLYPEDITAAEIRFWFWASGALCVGLGGLFVVKMKMILETEDYASLLKKWETNKEFREQYKKHEEAFAALNSICERLRPHLSTLQKNEIEEYLIHRSVCPWAKELLEKELNHRETL